MDLDQNPVEKADPLDLAAELSALRVSNAVLLKYVIEARDYMKLTHFRAEVISRFDATIAEARKIQKHTLLP